MRLEVKGTSVECETEGKAIGRGAITENLAFVAQPRERPLQVCTKRGHIYDIIEKTRPQKCGRRHLLNAPGRGGYRVPSLLERLLRRALAGIVCQGRRWP